ncbi:MAG: helicase-related protein [Candidatus Heimdallarchaeota archaeon]
MKLLREARVILTTPQKLSNLFKKAKSDDAFSFDIIIINEIDKIIRRMGGNRVLVYPWVDLLSKLPTTIKIGMSGTMRDSHYVLDKDQIEVRKELDTLREYIPNSELIFMDYLAGTDVTEYKQDTKIEAIPVNDSSIEVLSEIITNQLREAYNEIKQELMIEDPDFLEQVNRIGPQALLQAPVSESLRGKASSLSMLPTTPNKIEKVVEIAKESNKIVVLCSYIKTVKTIASYLTRHKIKPFIVTGQIFDKNAILQEFRNCPEKSALIMSPVGERDIDLPEAEKLIIFDSVRTIKTVYQQLKRIRGGYGLFLYYANTYEERKVNSVMREIIERYPWSTVIAPNNEK